MYDRFCLEPKANSVPCKFFSEVMACLPLDLDAYATAPNVSDENY
jgi:hypothetical protein